MTQIDLSSVDFEKCRLHFERDRYTKDFKETLQERDERHLERREDRCNCPTEREEGKRDRGKERGEASKIEFETFKLMMNAFINEQQPSARSVMSRSKVFKQRAEKRGTIARSTIFRRLIILNFLTWDVYSFYRFLTYETNILQGRRLAVKVT